MGRHNKDLGDGGERAAAAAYRRSGFEVLEANWRCSSGEIDLILRRGDTLVFAEVKTRSSDRFGSPAEAVGPAKQRRLRALGATYLRGSGGFAVRVRFDVVAVRPGPHGMSVDIIEGAF